MVVLSRGGADAVVRREFGWKEKSWVEGCLSLPETKSRCAWHSRAVVLACTDTGTGSLTDSGYPRTVRERRRGTALEQSAEVRMDDESACCE
jgi:prolyl oligopeptidase